MLYPSVFPAYEKTAGLGTFLNVLSLRAFRWTLLTSGYAVVQAQTAFWWDKLSSPCLLKEMLIWRVRRKFHAAIDSSLGIRFGADGRPYCRPATF
jgi:hypothetical protein